MHDATQTGSNKTSLTRRVFLRTGIGASTALAVSAGSQGVWAARPSTLLRPEKSKITIAVSGLGSFAALPLLVAQQMDYFADEGLEVEVDDLAGTARVQQSIFSGTADVASGSFDHMLALSAKSLPVRAFVMQGRAPTTAFGVSNRNLPGLNQLSELKGRRVGISAPGMSTHIMAQLVLEKAGLRAGEVGFVGVGSGAGALAALRSGQIDALCNVDPVMTMLELRGDVKIVADCRTIKGAKAIFGGPMPSSCLYASTEFTQKHPQTTQALGYAMVRALKWLQTAGPRDMMRLVPEAHLLGDRALYLAAFERVRESISTDGVLALDAARTALKVLTQFDPSVQASKIDLSATFTNTFALKAKRRFGA